MAKLLAFGLLMFLLGGILIPIILGTTGLTGAVAAAEHASPKDRIQESQVRVMDDKVVLTLENAEWARFADTNSMDPLFDNGANALQIVPQTPEDIEVGDIITYRSGASHIIHRVVYIGEDDQGIYYIVKGDNNKVADPGKVRFEQVDRVVVAILY